MKTLFLLKNYNFFLVITMHCKINISYNILFDLLNKINHSEQFSFHTNLQFHLFFYNKSNRISKKF